MARYWWCRHATAGTGESSARTVTDVVLEQLAELLGEPMPAYLTDATRDAHLIGMLAEAATACQQRDERWSWCSAASTRTVA